MVTSVIGIRFCFQLDLRRLGSFSNLQPTREPESESDSGSVDTEVTILLQFTTLQQSKCLLSKL